MTSNRAPTPWKAERAPHGVLDIFDANDHDIFTMFGDDGKKTSNAAFIVQACNAYDDLIKELEAATDQLEKAVSGDRIDTSAVNRILGREILSTAKGEV